MTSPLKSPGSPELATDASHISLKAIQAMFINE